MTGSRLGRNPRYLRRVATDRQADRQPACSGTVSLLWLEENEDTDVQQRFAKIWNKKKACTGEPYDLLDDMLNVFLSLCFHNQIKPGAMYLDRRYSSARKKGYRSRGRPPTIHENEQRRCGTARREATIANPL